MTRPQGLKGEVRVEVILEDDRVFQPGGTVQLIGRLGERPAEIEDFRRQHGRVVIKLRGIDSIADAEKLTGAELAIQSSALEPLDQGQFYTFQLKGCRVYAADEFLGAVTGVLDSGGTEILSVELDGNEILIPFAEAYLKRVDVEGQRIDVELPEGLRDLNSPGKR